MFEGLVYGEDRYGRCVGDVYSNNIFLQSRLYESHCHTLTQNFQVVDHGDACIKKPKLAMTGRVFSEMMLKKGLARHYTAYDHRMELANREKEA
ncbi:hypothetical protein Ancab_034547 [Ancistrocladus abbreviatus]